MMSSLQRNYDQFNFIPVRPSQIMDQRFGLVLDAVDFATPLIYPVSAINLGKEMSNYYRPWRPKTSKSDQVSTVRLSKTQFQAILDVQQFAPAEIFVKIMSSNVITVEGKHDEKQDQYGFVSRQFIRKYILPENYDTGRVVSSLSKDGVLTIIVPRLQENSEEQRSIPILQTDFAFNAIATEEELEINEEKEEKQEEQDEENQVECKKEE